jgi:ABC-type transport system involved in multi-copper enzyme maturation permease subunit
MRESAMQAPGAGQVVGAIARREILLASKRRLLRLLFLLSVLPPIVLILILVVRNMAEQFSGTRIPWDPLVHFIQFQSLPVALLALGLGTPVIARDRAEDVLFLYATRPVLPWHYALGRMLAVAGPAAALLLVPGLLIVILRVGVTGDLDIGPALEMLARLSGSALLTACGLAGVAVGASAVTRRARWAMFLALACFTVPDVIAKLISPRDPWPLGLGTAVAETIASAFSRADHGAIAACALLFFAATGYVVIVQRVRGEMIP